MADHLFCCICRRRNVLLYVLSMTLLSCAAVPESGAQGRTSYIVVDATHGKILSEYKSEREVPVASLTKVATACVVLDWIDASRGSTSDMMMVSPQAVAGGGANPLGLAPGDRISVRSALHSAMLGSDNVAANTLAEHFGRQMMARAGGRDPMSVFVGQMNALVVSLGMTSTEFTNPSGLDHYGKVGYSSARDMALLTLYALKKPSFNFICSQTERQVTFDRAGQSLSFVVKNTNKLLGTYGVDGVKTGTTQRAGECLIASARKQDKIIPLNENQKRRIPYRIVCVVLNSPDRFGQTAQLIQAGWGQYEAWINGGMPVASAKDLLRLPR